MRTQETEFRFPTTLIIGGDQTQRRDCAFQNAEEILAADPRKLSGIDFFAFGTDTEPTNLGIEDVRQLQRELITKPYQAPRKVALLLEAQRLTVAAQNCLLKTLEEPPNHAFLILTAPDAESVLPTVRSRCRLVDLGQVTFKEQAEDRQLLATLLHQDRGERLFWVEKNKKEISERETVLKLLDQWLVTAREEMLRVGAGNNPYVGIVKQLTKTKETVATVNVNLRLSLENLLLHFPVPDKAARAKMKR